MRYSPLHTTCFRRTGGLISTLTTLLMATLAMPVFAATVDGVRMWSSPDNTRLVFDISEAVDHKVFVLKNPHRVVVDLKNAHLLHKLAGLDFPKSLLTGLRSAKRHGTDLRMVLDLKGKVRPKSFLLKPTQRYGHRLVIDLQDARSKPAKVVTRTAANATKGQARDVIVAIDAGHGGDDPGASGRRGTREKDVVMAIARELEKLVKKQRGMRPVMIRQGDYYLGLRKRMQKARDLKADLFISIHADAFRDGRARGASVFVLSQNSATSKAAQWLAANENSADLIGGVSLDDKDDLLASVLLDLSRNATIAASLDVGSNVLSELKKIGRVHKRRVEQAGFVVLKSPDVPSILVETGFISNRHEEKNLRSKAYQRKLARAMLKGVKTYFANNAPAGTLLAMDDRQHVIRRGETLSGIAQQYRVTQLALRSANGLSSDGLRIGQTLRIPMM
ncbi:MAG: AMIN domain-containing protein [Gammaproteobacteria bacterium]|nr:AMIN domain-containing protein [Gammaproteobacteria bacterium]